MPLVRVIIVWHFGQPLPLPYMLYNLYCCIHLQLLAFILNFSIFSQFNFHISWSFEFPLGHMLFEFECIKQLVVLSSKRAIKLCNAGTALLEGGIFVFPGIQLKAKFR